MTTPRFTIRSSSGTGWIVCDAGNPLPYCDKFDYREEAQRYADLRNDTYRLLNDQTAHTHAWNDVQRDLVQPRLFPVRPMVSPPADRRLVEMDFTGIELKAPPLWQSGEPDPPAGGVYLERYQQVNKAQIVLAPVATKALRAFVDTVDSTGGLVRTSTGLHLAADEDWFDLATAYEQACAALGLPPVVQEDNESGEPGAGYSVAHWPLVRCSFSTIFTGLASRVRQPSCRLAGLLRMTLSRGVPAAPSSATLASHRSIFASESISKGLALE